jgi:hypothetical protein
MVGVVVPGIFRGGFRVMEPTRGNKRHPGMVHIEMDGPGLNRAAERSLNRLHIEGIDEGGFHCDGNKIHVVAKRGPGSDPLSLRHLRTLSERVFRALQLWARDNEENIFVFTECTCTPDDAMAVNSDSSVMGGADPRGLLY